MNHAPRRCTKAQSAFLSSSRAARFSSAAHAAPEEASTAITTMARTGLETPEFCPRSPPGFISTGTEAGGRGIGVDVGLGQHNGGRGGMGIGALGVGLSCTVMEELDKIERACSQRCSALKEEEPFVGTLGMGMGMGVDESPVAV